MNGPNFEIVRELFLEARDLDHAGRAAVLEARCGDDHELRREIESLLAHHDANPSWAETPAARLPADLPGRSTDHNLPRSFGDYELLEVLGHGGMGTVYRAQQRNPQRTVAIKMISHGLMAPAMLSRFQHEAHVLGRLQHPGIAQIFEAGSAEIEHGAQPYFAMELIDGTPLDAYARQHTSTIRQRIELIIKICDAVHHAHQKCVVHRDLKPGNILVDATGQPRILDFGIARATDSDIRATTLQTQAGQIIGTLPYMSPEQVTGDPSSVDLRSDVYSIGVLMYELLSEHLPYELDRRSLPEAARVIADDPPTRLSSIDTTLRGDIETIVNKALEKNPDRRYQSAAALAEDLQRFLNHEPIAARRPSSLYQARLFARRHRVLVGAVAVIFIALLAATIISATFGLREQAAADRESRQRDVAQRISGYIATIMQLPDPHLGGADTTVLEMVEELLAKLDATEDELPEVEGDVRRRIGRMYLAVGRHDDAVIQLTQATECLRSVNPDDSKLGEACNDLGIAHAADDNYGAALSAHVEALRIARMNPTENLRFAVLLANLANNYIQLEQFDAAGPLLVESVEIRRAHPGPSNLHLVAGLRHLGRWQTRTGALTDAEKTLIEAVDICRGSIPPRYPIFSMTLLEYGQALHFQDRYDEARKSLEEAWQLARDARTPGSGDWSAALYAYADCLFDQQDSEAIESLLAAALAAVEHRHGADSDAAAAVRTRSDRYHIP